MQLLKKDLPISICPLRENPRGKKYQGRLYAMNESFLQIFSPEAHNVAIGAEIQAEFQIDVHQFSFECVVVRLAENLVFVNRPSVIRKSKLREGPRVKIAMPIHYTLWSEPGRFEADLQDISETGIRIVSRHALKKQMVVSLDLYFRDSKIRVICQGQVAWSQATEENRYLFESGIQFTTISNETKSNLALYLLDRMSTPEYAEAARGG